MVYCTDCGHNKIEEGNKMADQVSKKRKVLMFCVQCQEKQSTSVEEEYVTKNNRLVVKGFCPQCGTKITTILGLPKQ